MTAPPPPDDLLGIVRHHMEALPDQDPALLLFGDQTDEVTLIPCEGENPSDKLFSLGLMIVAGLIEKPSWIGLGCDTFGCEQGRDEEHPGNLALLYEQGDPRVYEAIQALMIAPDGPGYQVQQRYERHPGGGFTWNEPEPYEQIGVGGRLPETMKLVLSLDC